ncbi:MAG TPA: hypothetical protein VHD63_11620, partial [Ktedonobacteraceae bacterium]|nr:hypothetical protein [Ktedonobacteraceae bacterium]
HLLFLGKTKRRLSALSLILTPEKQRRDGKQAPHSLLLLVADGLWFARRIVPNHWRWNGPAVRNRDWGGCRKTLFYAKLLRASWFFSIL